MRDMVLARLMAEANHCVPAKFVRVEGNPRKVIYEFPEEFDGLLLETGEQISRVTKARRRQVKNQGTWGFPASVDQDQDTGRTLLTVLLYKDRKIPGPEFQVFVQFCELSDFPDAPYVAEFIFREGREPELYQPEFGSQYHQSEAHERKRRAEKRAELASLNEKRTYPRTAGGHQPNPRKAAARYNQKLARRNGL